MYNRLLSLAEVARAYIAQGWTQGYDARYSDGRGCDPSDPEAVSFCLVGAVWAGRTLLGQPYPLLRCLMDHIELTLPDPAFLWNDDPRRTKEEVLAVFDSVIDELRGHAAEPAGALAQSHADNPQPQKLLPVLA
jgi:hypothetical protein